MSWIWRKEEWPLGGDHCKSPPAPRGNAPLPLSTIQRLGSRGNLSVVVIRGPPARECDLERETLGSARGGEWENGSGSTGRLGDGETEDVGEKVGNDDVDSSWWGGRILGSVDVFCMDCKDEWESINLTRFIYLLLFDSTQLLQQRNYSHASQSLVPVTRCQTYSGFSILQ
jgi:hypothetical protein